MTALAIFTVALAIGTWLGIRWAEAGAQLRAIDLATYLLSIPPTEWDDQHSEQHP